MIKGPMSLISILESNILYDKGFIIIPYVRNMLFSLLSRGNEPIPVGRLQNLQCLKGSGGKAVSAVRPSQAGLGKEAFRSDGRALNGQVITGDARKGWIMVLMSLCIG